MPICPYLHLFKYPLRCPGAGFYQNFDKLGAWITWLQYISFIRYGYEALMINEYCPLYSATCLPTHLAERHALTLMPVIGIMQTAKQQWLQRVVC